MYVCVCGRDRIDSSNPRKEPAPLPGCIASWGSLSYIYLMVCLFLKCSYRSLHILTLCVCVCVCVCVYSLHIHHSKHSHGPLCVSVMVNILTPLCLFSLSLSLSLSLC